MADAQRVAFITGAARGQGRAHAARLAADGADVIAVDICADIDTIPYPMGSREDLEQTCRLVQEQGRRASLQVADVRELAQLQRAFSAGTAALGVDCADIVIANAGGCAYPSDVDEGLAFRDAVDIMLVGVWNTVKATTQALVETGRPGSVVLTSSTAAVKGFTGGWGGLDGYTAAKAGILGLMRLFANLLGPNDIRVNAILPTGVDSGMTRNQAFVDWIGKMAENPVGNLRNVLPGVDVLQPADVANAVAWLVSDQARYLTGVCLPVDAGFCNA
ncbi:mycofactocin-coupled SDR family oxidoreductase [Mycolicibacterium holsaticum]|uniref:mycofactocin-coupled SDR family oxidoreductase n=1 Tax=Mycolicibacterium holsaticum TaxID=152142 RepID=UPI001C7CF688|nr:mycofactocin-coupled SDR family oxidoreductase [Mycolicibacterium holsaticum]MDA4108133.1 3-ketoacyl-ACP reductase [Mycolicibacterium holsaticum DSM 44478 = JCM 12374]QZA14455.1 mycofactocin-coupled SDR family oxidoreductase [Mycolicibacterium holsaticum DSM 44478 = JCM 12374]UNC08096.1 mycofactocin-coupled SDR family oxidoreductase [Mycolicibacterium holsaticum DSM 44478 = JCM 12374]